MEIYDAYLDKINNPGDWLERNELKKFLNMEKSTPKFNAYIKEIKALKDSYLYVQGTLVTNETFNKVRIYNYINHTLREKERS